MTENATPRDAASRLAVEPSYLPPGATPLPAGMTLAHACKGDLVALDGRWVVIQGCTDVCGWVTLHVGAMDVRAVVAKNETPVHLARKESARARAAVAPGV